MSNKINNKTAKFIGLFMLLIFVNNGCKKKESTAPLPLAIGNSYQGGIVAYILKEGDTGYIAGQTHGLIAANSDQHIGVEWGCYSTSISGADHIKIGSGMANTKAIMDSCITTETAARICGDLILHNYDDWYLPSKEELYKLYENKELIGRFEMSGSYWSSSQYDSKGAWKLVFSSGQLISYGKASTNYVRAVRSF